MDGLRKKKDGRTKLKLQYQKKTTGIVMCYREKIKVPIDPGCGQRLHY